MCECGHKFHYHDRQWGTCDVVGCFCDGFAEVFVAAETGDGAHSPADGHPGCGPDTD